MLPGPLYSLVQIWPRRFFITLFCCSLLCLVATESCICVDYFHYTVADIAFILHRN